MPRKRESLKYALNKRAFQNTKNSKNNNTETSYKRSINQFVEWAKKRGYKTADEVTKETIQEYEEFLEGHPKSYQPSTIHTFLTPICVATGVSMGEIRKPKRTAGRIVRSRDNDTDENNRKNSQGLKEECSPKYARVVSFQKAVGIRRAELADLLGMDLIYTGEDRSVLVRQGKGGKTQLQRILPQDVDKVREIFAGIEDMEKVFSKEELNNKIDFHGMRAENARRCYVYYAEKIEAEPGFAEEMRRKLMNRWLDGHERFRKTNPDAWLRQKKLFEREIDDRPYRLRGDNLTKALASGSPKEYNRLALMCVSVMHLAHWRLDVTVTNYIVK